MLCKAVHALPCNMHSCVFLNEVPGPGEGPHLPQTATWIRVNGSAAGPYPNL